MLGRITDVVIYEVDYSLRASSVVIGKDASGNLRKSRGFMGWVIYRSCAPRKLQFIVGKLLALANIMGLGRSRGVGLGHVTVVEL